MNKRKIKFLITQALDGLGHERGISRSELESLYAHAIHDRHFHDALLASLLMYLQLHWRGHAEAQDTLRLVQETIKLVLGKSDDTVKTNLTPPQVKGKPYCAFCGKSKKEVEILFAGPIVFICNECVSTCVKLSKQPKTSRPPISGKKSKGQTADPASRVLGRSPKTRRRIGRVGAPHDPAAKRARK